MVSAASTAPVSARQEYTSRLASAAPLAPVALAARKAAAQVLVAVVPVEPVAYNVALPVVPVVACMQAACTAAFLAAQVVLVYKRAAACTVAFAAPVLEQALAVPSGWLSLTGRWTRRILDRRKRPASVQSCSWGKAFSASARSLCKRYRLLRRVYCSRGSAACQEPGELEPLARAVHSLPAAVVEGRPVAVYRLGPVPTLFVPVAIVVLEWGHP